MLKALRQQIRDLLKIIPSRVREYASHSLHITTAIKSFLESPLVELGVAIIPTDLDDKARKILLDAANKALPYLTVVDVCKDEPTAEAKIQCWAIEIKKYPPHMQNALLAKFAALIVAIMDNNELRQSSYDYAIQTLYTAGKP